LAITEQEFKEWLESPITIRLKRQIATDVSDMKDMLCDTTDLETIREIQGRIKAASNFLEIKYEDLYERTRN
jgi:DNA-binding transcriptional regulator GbsR (MarR family)